MRKSTIAICSIVRDCKKKLKKNIPIIEKFRTYFQSSIVIVFENDSIDGTKNVLLEWGRNSSNVYIESRDFKIQTIPSESTASGINKYFSYSRISKMAEYRNQYLEKLKNINYLPDFVMVVDLDISNIFIDGIVHSFAFSDEWDVVCSNSYSYSPRLRRRYHDSYALTELGQEDKNQTEDSILQNQKRWAKLRAGMPLIPVYSAFGGLSIYRYAALKNIQYKVIKNNGARVEARCEHYALCHGIRKKGFSRIYINPSMEVKYQSIDYHLIKKYIQAALDRRVL